MKIGELVNANSKGQIVIPQKYRELFGISSGVALNITPKYNGIFIEPIADVLPQTYVGSDEMYLKVLEATKGAWGKIDPENKSKESIELKASLDRKQAW